MKVIHYNTNVFNKKPEINNMSFGEIGINYCKGSEQLFIKNSENEIISFTPESKGGG